VRGFFAGAASLVNAEDISEEKKIEASRRKSAGGKVKYEKTTTS